MAGTALYLSGGGARGAYQVGVLKAVAEITKAKKVPFDIISSVSVGSINAIALAEHINDFPLAIKTLENFWRHLHTNAVFKASNWSLIKSVFSNLLYFMVKRKKPSYLLNSLPLRHLISNNADFEKIQANIEQGLFQALEMTSNCYDLHKSISFYQHFDKEFEDWNLPKHVSRRTEIACEHVLAACAIPLFFPSIKIDGLFYGDGSLRLISPLRACIKFNADKIFVCGGRQLTDESIERSPIEAIGFSHILGNMMNSLFMDNLDRDIELVEHMNAIAELLSRWKMRRSPWRPIDVCYMHPHFDVAVVADAHYNDMPYLLRFLLNSMGAKQQSGDLLSFLLFEGDFCGELLDLAYQETMDREEQVIDFFDK